MQVAMYYNNNDIRIEEVEVPKIGQGEVLVKVMASGICGSDVMEWYRIKKAPLVLGHEIAGKIVKIGEGVNNNYKIGDRVFVSHHVPCNECYLCLRGHHTACETLHSTNYDPGGFAEYIRVPQRNVQNGMYLLPEEVSYEAATFIEPLGCVIRAQRLANIQGAHSVLIIGSGISGLLHIQLAKLANVGRVIATDINKYRLNKAIEYGADKIIHVSPDEDDISNILCQINEGRLAEKVIICAGVANAAKQAFKAVDKGGTILFFAVPPPDAILHLPITTLWRNEITLMTSYGASPEDLNVALQLIKNNKIDTLNMITHRLALSEIALGFKLMIEGKENLKIIIEPHKNKK